MRGSFRDHIVIAVRDGHRQPKKRRKPSPEILSRLGTNLRILRRRRGYSQEALGRLCGMPKSQISNLERALTNVKVVTVEAVSKPLKCSVADLLSPPPTPYALTQFSPAESDSPELSANPPQCPSRDHPTTRAELMERLAANMVRLRNDRGWTQRELANRCGCASSFISRIEMERSSVTLSTIAMLLQGFACTTTDLFWRDVPKGQIAAKPFVPFHQGETMLTLIRHAQQALHIGPDIRVDILDVYPDRRVQVGITAPREIEIQQAETITVTCADGNSIATEARGTVDPAVFPSITMVARSVVEEAPGKAELLVILDELDQTLQAAQDAVNSFLQTTRGLLDLHAGLVEVRRFLEPLREQIQFLEDEARAIFHSTSGLSGYDSVMSQIRESDRVLNDLLFALPHQHRKPDRLTRPRRVPTA